MRVKIAATGRYIPRQRIHSSETEQKLGLERGWIKSRTGVNARAIADPNEALTDLAIEAGKIALENFDGGQHPPISALFLATSTPDHLLPPSAPRVAYELGLSGIGAMDLTVACCGFLYGLKLADAIVRSDNTSVLLIAANVLSRRIHPNDPATNAIFADGAGAVVFAPTDDDNGILQTAWSSDGSGWDGMIIPDGGSRNPFGINTFADSRHLMQIKSGSDIFRYAVESMTEMGRIVLRQASLSTHQIDWWIPHQANIRIIQSAGRMLNIPAEQTLTTVQQFGNSSAATIPVTLDKAIRLDRKIKPGDLVLLTAAAAGMTSAAALFRV